ncbi:sigma factor-like helix-turn-helix DNA-binding protein [Sporosarcina sp. ITBMC105]
MTLDYNAVLAQEVAHTRQQVRAGAITAEGAIKPLDDATRAYAEAQAEHYAALRNPPIALRNGALLDAAADTLMHDYLTWSHFDKMNIVENPILSDTQLKLRHKRETTLGDVYTGGKGDETIGRQRGGDGIKHRIYDFMTPNRDNALVPARYLTLYDALDNAGLTQRQREAIDLVYFEDLTQADAAERMGVTQQAVAKFVRAALRTLRVYMAQK